MLRSEGVGAEGPCLGGKSRSHRPRHLVGSQGLGAGSRESMALGQPVLAL